MKHTKEPWVVRVENTDFTDETGTFTDIRYIIWPKSTYKNSMGFEVTQEIAFCGNGIKEKHDAKRIVACVNFCTNFSNEQLSEMKSLKDVLASVDLRPDEISIMNKWRAKDKDLEQ